MIASYLIECIRNGEYDTEFNKLYSDIERQKKRYIRLIERYA